MLARRRDLPPRGLPLAGPLQHQTTPLPLPPFQPRHIRKDPHTRYAARSRLTTNPVSTTWGQGPGELLRMWLSGRRTPVVDQSLKAIGRITHFDRYPNGWTPGDFVEAIED